jgi:hypothetical protein
VKKKISSLWANYRKDVKDVNDSKRSDIGTDDVYQPKCWTFKELRFLKVSECSKALVEKSK